ncbi:MAG: hypothetical protein HFE84_02240 [Lachnospiraceae bacterium]|nr:hypothetical protein [Lachnospiraceae bacterium]
MKKGSLFQTLCLSTAMILVFPLLSYAGEWQETSSQKRWLKDDGTHAVSQWEWIDDDNDGFAKCYYFDANGNLLTNTTTPDNYTVDHWGAWNVDYVPQIRRVLPPADPSQGSKMPSVYMNNNHEALQSVYPEGVNVYDRQIGSPELTVDGIIVDGNIYAYFTGQGTWEKSVQFYMNGTVSCEYYLPSREEFVENCRRAKIVYSHYLDWEKEQVWTGIDFGRITYYGDGKGASFYDYAYDTRYIFDLDTYKTTDSWNLKDYKVDKNYSYQLQN